MLGMVAGGNDESPGPFIDPDYKVDIAIFYQRVTESLMARFPRLYALSSVGLGHAIEGNRVPGLPSWVVNWTATRIAEVTAFGVSKSDAPFRSGYLVLVTCVLPARIPRSTRSTAGF